MTRQRRDLSRTGTGEPATHAVLSGCFRTTLEVQGALKAREAAVDLEDVGSNVTLMIFYAYNTIGRGVPHPGKPRSQEMQPHTHPSSTAGMATSGFPTSNPKSVPGNS